MGDKVSLNNALVIALFSMVVVFLVLILISTLIGLLKSFSKEDKKETKIESIQEEALEKEVYNDEELVAVIAAAVAVSLGLNIPDINIKSIRRVPQNSLAWSEMGKREQLLGKL